MGRAIDLFVTYRFLKLLTTPFEKMDAYKLGIIDEDGNRIMQKGVKKPEVELVTSEQKNAYTILHKLVFNIKKIFAKVPRLRTLDSPLKLEFLHDLSYPKSAVSDISSCLLLSISSATSNMCCISSGVRGALFCCDLYLFNTTS